MDDIAELRLGVVAVFTDEVPVVEFGVLVLAVVVSVTPASSKNDKSRIF